jgi:hypothetical protein
MIGRKLIMLQNGTVFYKEEAVLKTPYLEELKDLTLKNVKKHSYTGLVAIIRFYVRLSNFLKNKYQEVKTKIKNIQKRNSEGESLDRQEISKFLKIISEYKHKIKEIKHKIKEEENL